MAKELVKAAIEASTYAYVPYSKFKVGAALRTADQDIITGCNVENASYGLSNCAERTAIFKAISEGKTKFTGIAIVGKTDGPISPCGACRQVLAEMCPPDMKVWLANFSGEVLETTVKALLPGAFSKGDLTTIE
nr:cytidine deaminase [Polycladospora coralii]